LSDETKEEKENTEGPNLITPNKAIFFDDDWKHLGANKKKNYNWPTLMIPKNVMPSILYNQDDTALTLINTYVNKVLPHSEDPVRTYLGKIWHYYSNKDVQFLADVMPIRVPLKDYTITDYKTISHGHWFTKEEILTIRYHGSEQLERAAELVDSLQSQGKSSRHTDLTSVYALPAESSELESMFGAIGNRALYVKPSTAYNYYIPSYENLINSKPGKFTFPPDSHNSEGLEDFIEKILPDLQTGIVDRVSADTVEGVTSTGAKTITSNILLTDLHLTLADYIQGLFKNSLSDKGKLKQNVNKPKSGSKSGTDVSNEGRYFEIWTKIIRKILDKSSEIATEPADLTKIMKLFNIYKTKIIPAATVPLLNEYDGRKYLYPMFNEIEFSTGTKTRLADLLSDFKLGYAVLKSIAQGIGGKLQDHPESAAQGGYEFDGRTAYQHKAGRRLSGRRIHKVFLASRKGLKVYGASANTPWGTGLPGVSSFNFLSPQTDWLDRYLYENVSNIDDFYAPVDSEKVKIAGSWPFTDHALLIKPDSYPVNSPPNSAELQLADLDNIDNKFFKTVYTTIFKKRLAAIVREKTRSFKDILDGEKAHSETIAYRVEKWSVKDDQPDEQIQDTLLQNSSKIDVLNYVDTQVRYEIPYIYKIYSWNAIFGSQYQYELIPTPEAEKSTSVLQLVLNQKLELGGVYRAAAHLLAVDLTQRLWFKKKLPTSQTTGDDTIPSYTLSDADLELLDAIGCGAPIDYEKNSPIGFAGGAAKCIHSEALKNSMPETNNTSGCCSKYSDAKLTDFEKDVFSLYSEHMDNALGFSGDKFVFSFKDSHFDLEYRNYGNEDPYLDLFSATLNSIIARRVKWMVDNGVTIEATNDEQSSFSKGAKTFRDGSSWENWTSGGKIPQSPISNLFPRWDAIRNVVGTSPSPWYDNSYTNQKFNIGGGGDTGLFGLVHPTLVTSKLEQVGDFPDRSLSFDIPFLDAYKFLKAFDLMQCRPYRRVLDPGNILTYNIGSSVDESKFKNAFSRALENYRQAVETYIVKLNSDKIAMFGSKMTETGTKYDSDLMGGGSSGGGPGFSDITSGNDSVKEDLDQQSSHDAHSLDLASVKGEVNILVSTHPTIKVVEVPYYTTPVMKIQDYPPVYPNVDIIPYKGFSDRVLINLSSNTGEIKEAPTGWTHLEYTQLKDYYKREYGDGWQDALATRRAQWDSVKISGSPVTFRSDDMAVEYEIRRIDGALDKPSPDSPNNLDSQFRSHFDSKINIPSKGFSSVSFIDDTLKPNVKYYYVFRVKDSHGHMSNPTPIYQVELVDTDGAVYLLMELYRPKTIVGKKGAAVDSKLTKKARRYIHIDPALRHALIDEEKTFEGDITQTAIGKTPVLGVESPSLFDAGDTQKFKIRLTSKDTGKKIDLNLRFVHQHQKTPTEESNDQSTNTDSDTANG